MQIAVPSRSHLASYQAIEEEVDASLKLGENVMLDTGKMTPTDVASLKAEGAARGWGDKVQWFP